MPDNIPIVISILSFQCVFFVYMLTLISKLDAILAAIKQSQLNINVTTKEHQCKP